jgi:hypothetical protein
VTVSHRSFRNDGTAELVNVLSASGDQTATIIIIVDVDVVNFIPLSGSLDVSVRNDVSSD